MIEILRFYIFVYTPQSQQLPLRIARSVSDTILSHALGLDLKELGKVLLAAPKSRHVDDFNLTLRHDFQEWALMEEKGKLRCKSEQLEQPGLYAGGLQCVACAILSPSVFLSSLQLRESAETDITV